MRGNDSPTKRRGVERTKIQRGEAGEGGGVEELFSLFSIRAESLLAPRAYLRPSSSLPSYGTGMPDAPDSTPSTPSAEAASPSERYREAEERFILFWGEMASNWGINRTMAQIHALLYVSEEALDTDTIMERLQISRGNANMNLRSLMNWNLARKVHQPGSRKDYYWAEKDVWFITAQIIKERERREIKPVMQQLEECREILWGDREGEPDCSELPPQENMFCQRIDNLSQLMQVFEGFSRTLLPFVQERNAATIKQLIQLAQSFRPVGDEGEDA